VLARLSMLGAKVVVPAHGDYGTGAMIEEQREAFAFIRSRVDQLKAMKVPVDEAVKTIADEFAKTHSSWTTPNRAGAIVRGMYTE